MKDKPTWQNEINKEIARRTTPIAITPPQISPEHLERNRQGELSQKRVVETLQGMVMFNTDIVPVLSSLNREVWNNLGTITVSDCSLKGFFGQLTGFIHKSYGFKSIALIHESTAYSGEYEEVKRTKHGRYTRTGGSGGGWNSPEATTSWSREAFGSYTEIGRRLVKINQQEKTDSISVTLGYSDMTGLFELRVTDSKVNIESRSFTEFPDKRWIHTPVPTAGYHLSEDEDTGIVAYQRGYGPSATIYDIDYKQLYLDPSVVPAGDLLVRTGYHYVGPRYKKVPFRNYTIVGSEKGIALFFSKEAVDRDKILNFLNHALVIAGVNRKMNKRLPQDIDWKNREELKNLQSRLGKKDFSAPHIEWS